METLLKTRHFLQASSEIIVKHRYQSTGMTNTSSLLRLKQRVFAKIYRQRIPRLREAIENLTRGRIDERFEELDKSGAIQEIPDTIRLTVSKQS